MSAAVAPPLHDTIARPVATGLVPSGVEDEALDVRPEDAAVGEQLGVAFVDRPRVAGAGDAGDDGAGGTASPTSRVSRILCWPACRSAATAARSRRPGRPAGRRRSRDGAIRAIRAPPRVATGSVDPCPGRYVRPGGPVSRATPLAPRSAMMAADRPPRDGREEERAIVTDLDYGRLRGPDLRLLRHAHRLGGRDPGRPAAGPGAARRSTRPTTSCSRQYAAIEAPAEAGPYRTLPRDPRRRRSSGVAARYGVAAGRGGGRRRSPIRSATGRPSPIRPRRSRRLHERFRLGVITNCDDDLFARSATRLGDDVRLGRDRPAGRRATSPTEHNFEVAFERIGLPRERILHVAQSLYHDHVTAKRLGLDDGLDRPPARPPGARRDAAGRTPRRTRPSRTWRRSPRRRPRPEGVPRRRRGGQTVAEPRLARAAAT